jgi:ribonuclease HI
LKTQYGFIQSALKVARSLELYHETSILPLPMCPLDYTHLDINLELGAKVLKRYMIPEHLKAIALETIDTRFPESEWLHVFTDGSMLDRHHGAGAGVFCELFNFYLPVGPFTTAFDGEIEAIAVAVQQLALRRANFARAVIFSDSKSALQALSQNSQCQSQRILDCKSILKDLSHKISFQWVPAHCAITGNEHADFLAKKGAMVTQRYKRASSFHSLRLITNLTLRSNFKSEAAETSKNKKWAILVENPDCVPEAPRKAAVAHFRLLTGHDCLRSHLFRIGIADSAVCTLCDSGRTMTAEHLDECSALNGFTDFVEKYWRARALMA